MLPGTDLDKAIAVAHELQDISQSELTNELALYFGQSKAAEIVVELSQDGVFQWHDTPDGSYLAHVLPCTWCRWFPLDHTWSHEFNRTTFSDEPPHFYDYRMSTTP